MLYSGDKESYSSRIIHTAEEEAQFREIGLKDYADLPEPEPKIEEVTPDEAPQGFVTTEQFDAVAERLAAAESEIAELRESIAAKEEFFVPEAKYAEGVVTPQTSSDEMSSKPDDYSGLGRDELRAMVVEQGKSYRQNDTITQLIAILES